MPKPLPFGAKGDNAEMDADDAKRKRRNKQEGHTLK